MKKIRLSVISLTFFLLLIMLVSVQSVAAQSVNKEWTGKYEFFNGQPKVFRNSPSQFITYLLTVSQKGSSLAARFTAQGTQTADEFECNVQISGNSMKIIFIKDLNGLNEDSFNPYKKGQLLFTLTRTQTGKKPKYLFQPANYEIFPMSSSSKNRIYFEKKN